MLEAGRVELNCLPNAFRRDVSVLEAILRPKILDLLRTQQYQSKICRGDLWTCPGCVEQKPTLFDNVEGVGMKHTKITILLDLDGIVVIEIFGHVMLLTRLVTAEPMAHVRIVCASAMQYYPHSVL